MNEYLEDYVEAGFFEIVVLDHKRDESASGHKETTTETVVARKGDSFVSAVLRQHIDVYHSENCGRTLKKAKISEREYRKARKGNEIIDTPDELRLLKRQLSRRKKSARLHKEFISKAPDCPKCGSKMVYRSGPFGEFWGCPIYPRCQATLTMTTEAKKLYQEWAKA